jgi:hypothetical protein
MANDAIRHAADVARSFVLTGRADEGYEASISRPPRIPPFAPAIASSGNRGIAGETRPR